MTKDIDGYQVKVQIDGGEDAAGKEDVVILQGWGTTLQVYAQIAQLLAASGKYRVVRFNFPGFGDSDEPKERWAPGDFADWFVKFMQEMGIKKTTLMGHSYGGRVIIHLASRDPKTLPFSINRIVLVDAAGVMPVRTKQQEAKTRRYKRLRALFANPVMYALFRAPIDEWRSKQGSADYRAASPRMRECLVAAVNEDLQEKMPKIRQDTLLVWGDRDTATPLSDGQKMEALIPGSGLAVIKNAGHFSFLDQPVVFQNIMKAYFEL